MTYEKKAFAEGTVETKALPINIGLIDTLIQEYLIWYKILFCVESMPEISFLIYQKHAGDKFSNTSKAGR